MPVLFWTKKCLSFSRRQTKKDKEGTKKCLSFFSSACPFPASKKCLSFSDKEGQRGACPFPGLFFSRLKRLKTKAQNACPFPAFLFLRFPLFPAKMPVLFLSLSFSLSFSRLFPLFESDSKISILSPHFFRLEIQECLSWMHPALDAPCVLDATWMHVPGCT